MAQFQIPAIKGRLLEEVRTIQDEIEEKIIQLSKTIPATR